MAETPAFNPNGSSKDSPEIAAIKEKMNLQPHPEGGYFAETDRDPLIVPNPFRRASPGEGEGGKDPTRHASTTIYYFLSPSSPQGHFHRNKARTVHTLHWGRARYVLIHADAGGNSEEKRIETYTVGTDVLAGEKPQWIVEGGKYKASYLLPDAGEGGAESARGCLISETVVPGFEFSDHDFLEKGALERLVSAEKAEELGWLVRSG